MTVPYINTKVYELIKHFVLMYFLLFILFIQILNSVNICDNSDLNDVLHGMSDPSITKKKKEDPDYT